MPKDIRKRTLLHWRCHTPRMFDEMLKNSEMAVFRQPLQIFRGILIEVAQRAIELDDDKLNLLMLRLTLFDCADPELESYDPETIARLEKKVEKLEALKGE